MAYPPRHDTLIILFLCLTGLLLTGCLHSRGKDENGQQASEQNPAPLITLRLLDPAGNPLTPAGRDEQGNEIYRFGEDIRRIVLEAKVVNDSPTRDTQLSFDYQLIAGTATATGANPDYRIGRAINSDGDIGRVVFPGATRFSPAQDTNTASVVIVMDNMDEEALENFYMVFGNERGVRLSQRGYIFEIEDIDPRPSLSLAVLKDGLAQRQVSLSESQAAIELELSLSPSSSAREINVPLRFAGTAQAGVDYVAVDKFTIEAGQQVSSHRLLLSDDAIGDGDKTLLITLLTPDNAGLDDDISVEITLRDDEAQGQLNVTGITQCVKNAESEVLPCDDIARAKFPGQDAIVRAGAAFRFSEIEAGNCVLDENTGLMWELKTDSGLRNTNDYYTWYQPYDNRNGGLAGTLGGAEDCAGLESCDTDSYVRRINQTRLCGYDDWRLPRVAELLSLVDYAMAHSLANEPQIDLASFPFTANDNYWTATPVAGFPELVWVVDFRTGQLRKISKLANQAGGASLARIRLVRRSTSP